MTLDFRLCFKYEKAISTSERDEEITSKLFDKKNEKNSKNFKFGC